MPTHDDLTRQLKEKDRRLQQLKLTEARFGFNTPPEVLIEIEDLQAEMKALQRQLSALETVPVAHNSPEEPMETPRSYPKHFIRWNRQAWPAADLHQNGRPTGSRHALLNPAGQSLWLAELPGLLITGGAPLDSARFVFSTQSINPVDGGGSVRCFNIAGAQLWQWPSNTAAVSAPVILGGAIWVTLNTGVLVSLEPIAGRETARYPLPHTPATAAPIIADGAAYIPGNGPQVMAVGLDGAVRWVYAASAGSLSRTPVIIGEAIIAANANGEQSRVIALNRADGRELWQQALPTGADGFSPPATDGERVFIGGKSGLYALNPADGTIAWQFPTAPDKYILAAPVVAGETVFAACWDHRLYAFEAATGHLRWQSPPASRRLEVSPVIFPGEPPVALIADRSGAVTAIELPFAVTETQSQQKLSTRKDNPMTLSGPQYETLVSALTKAFPTPADLEMFVQFRLGQNLYAVAGAGSIPKMAYELVRHTEANGLTAKLVMAARGSKPNNAAFAQLAEELGLSAAANQPALSADNLERLIRTANSLLDLSVWRTKLAEIENRVCRVEITLNNGPCSGTGFLVGPDLLLTNYHVMQPVIEVASLRPHGNAVSWAEPGDVVCRFDYKILPGGNIVSAGTEYRLAANWLVDHSPMSPLDFIPPAQKTGHPQPDHLDYALIRLAGEPGNRGVGANPEPGAPKRGWFELPATGYTFAPHSPLVIVQHPDGKPVKLGLDTDAIIAANGNGTRVTYTTNTEPGSSGSPCFDINLNLVALHHAGDPNFSPTYNEGIPITAIRTLLAQRGKLPGASGAESLVQSAPAQPVAPPSPAAESAPPPTGLTKNARRRLEQRRIELQSPLETYNRRVAALIKDIALELDGQRKVILEERLAEAKAERDKIQTELDEIDDQLQGLH